MVVHSLLPLSPKPPKSFTSHLLSFNVNSPLKKKDSSRLSSRHQTLLFSRCYRNWCASTCEDWFEGLLHKVAERQHGQEYKYVDCKNREEAIALGHKSDDWCVSDHAHVNNILRRRNHIATNLAVSNTLFNNLLKFMVIFGFLTFQGSQPAGALSDVASGLQSIPYVGDLGDISTGIFADIFLRTRRQNLLHCSTFSC